MTNGKVFKIVLLGDGGVGKTSLVKQFVHQKFDDKYIKTLGTNIYKKSIVKKEYGRDVPITLQVWDVMGQHTFPQVVKTSLKGANGVILMCDVTRIESLQNLQEWIDITFENTEDVAFMFIGNKSDLPDVAYGFNAIKSVADGYFSPYYITSAKTGDSVDEAFNMMGELILNKRFIPDKRKPDIKVKVHDIPKILIVEDNIVNTFCNRMGGYEKAMPIVRKQFENLGIDFENPTKEQLQQLVQKLIEVMAHLTQEDMKKLKSDMMRHIQEI